MKGATHDMATAACYGVTLRRWLERSSAIWPTLFGVLVCIDPGTGSAAFASFMGKIAPLSLWGLLLVFAGAVRLCLLAVNGNLPWGLTARLWFCFGYLVCLWMPLSLSMVYYSFQQDAVGAGIANFGLIYAPICFTAELLCVMAISAELEAKKMNEANVTKEESARAGGQGAE